MSTAAASWRARAFHREALFATSIAGQKLTGAEKIIGRHEQELAATRQSLEKTSNELDETIKVAELLYDLNRRLGTVTHYLLREQRMAISDGEPKSVEAMLKSVVKQAEAEAPPKSEGGGGNVARTGATELESATMSQRGVAVPRG